MSDVVKWGILAAIIVAVIAALVATGTFQTILEFISSGTELVPYINSGIGVFGSALYTARGLINNFVIPQTFTYLLYISFFYWIIPHVITITMGIVRFLYK